MPWMRVLAWTAVAAVSYVPSLHAGIDVSWNDCVGGAPASNKNFVCTGAINQNYDLIFQFKTPVDVPNFVSLSARVDLVMPGPLCPFWHYEPTGCNAAPTGVGILDAMPASCESAGSLDPWNGGDGAIQALDYVPDSPREGRGRFFLSVSQLEPSPLVAGENYYAFHLRFSNRRRDTCAGCELQGEVVFQELTLESNDGEPAIVLSGPDKFSSCAGINGGGVGGKCAVVDPCPPVCFARTLGNVCGPTAVVRPTWGSVKMLYR